MRNLALWPTVLFETEKDQKHESLYQSITQNPNINTGQSDLTNIITFDTLTEYEEYVHYLLKNNKMVPDDLISQQDLDQLRQDQQERDIYYGMNQSDYQTESEQEDSSDYDQSDSENETD